MGRPSLTLPMRRFYRLLLVVSSIALLTIIHDHLANSSSRFQDRIQATLSNISLPFQQPPFQQPPSKDPSEDAYNSTLGYEKVFYISMPYRTDRQDAMNLIAHSTNIDLILERGVLGPKIHPNARPESSGGLYPAQLGCWRAHANLWSRMLTETITSALIIEDDADWDINVHDSFALVGKHMRDSDALRGRDLTEYEREAAPYGLDWDIMYVGHCWDVRNDSDPTHIHVNDPYAPSKPEMTDTYSNEIESYGYNLTNYTRQRLITNSDSPVCTIAYAITQKGAEKLLYNLGGYKGLDQPVDLAMAETVRSGITKAVTVIPPLIVDFSLDIKSDINQPPVDEPIGPLQGKSSNLRKSARDALAALGVSRKPQVTDEEPSDTPLEVKDEVRNDKEGEEELEAQRE